MTCSAESAMEQRIVMLIYLSERITGCIFDGRNVRDRLHHCRALSALIAPLSGFALGYHDSPLRG